MKHYLIEIATGDASIAGKSIYEYPDKNSALSGFHKKLGTAMGSSLYETDLVIVARSDGMIIANDTYIAPLLEEETKNE